MRELLHIDDIIDRVVRVFRRHGAVRVSTPLLMPRPPPQSSISAQLHQRALAGAPVDLITAAPSGLPRSPSLSSSLSFLAKSAAVGGVPGVLACRVSCGVLSLGVELVASRHAICHTAGVGVVGGADVVGVVLRFWVGWLAWAVVPCNIHGRWWSDSWCDA